jgi:hypothetical protein
MKTEIDTKHYTEQLSIAQMADTEGQWAVQRFLGHDFVAMRAAPQGRGGYLVEGLDGHSYQKFRMTKQLGAYIASFAVEQEAGDYIRTVAPLVSDRKTLVFVPVDGGQIRVYHYHE